MNLSSVDHYQPQLKSTPMLRIYVFSVPFARMLAVLFMAGFAAVGHAYGENEKTIVTYCVDPDWMPYEAIRNGVHIGISADYLDLIEELAPVEFSLIPTESWQQTLEYVQTGKCMAVAMLNVSPSRRMYLNFTLPFFDAPNVLVSKRNKPMLQGYGGITSEVVGVIKNYRQAEYIARYYPDVTLRYIKDEREGLALLASGEIDVLVGSLLSVNAQINRHVYDDIMISGYAEPYDSMGLGVNKAYPELVPLLNQAIRALPESSKVEIFKRWSNVKAYYYQDYRQYIILFLIVVILVLGFIWRRYIVRKYDRLNAAKNVEIEKLQVALLEKNRTLEFLSSHDSITGLYNRNFMLHKIEEEVSRFYRFHSSASLILVDFSNSYAHLDKSTAVLTEEVLKELAAVCLSSVREVDIAGRWGIEQYIILCPQTPKSAAEIIANRLKVSIEEHKNPAVNSLEFCIGIATLQDNENFSDWYERATKAVSASRRQSHNTVIVAKDK
jgi:diguanylate cyclase (GGDEF)-like protein